MPIEAIVFDVDNTLVDHVKMKFQCAYAGMDKMIERGLPITKEDARRILAELFRNYGWEDPLLFWHAAEVAGVKKDVDIERFAQIGKTTYRKKQRDHLKPYEGVPETLAHLRDRKIQLAILSDAPRLKVFDRLCDIDLEPFFENNVVGGDYEDKYKKPHPDAFRKVLLLLGRESPENVMMVGDNPIRDIMGARNFGFTTAFAKYGYVLQPGEDINTVKTRADYVLEQFPDLVAIVEKNP